MDIQKLIELEIERRAYIHTANEMSKGDACMETTRYELVQSLRKKAEDLQRVINANTPDR